MKKLLLLSLIGFSIVCMSFVTPRSVQKKSFTFKHYATKAKSLTIYAVPGSGAKEFTIQVEGADPDAIGIKVYIIFNGDPSTEAPYTVSLDNGYGFLDQQTSFDVIETEVDYSINPPTYLY